ncbi:hypothetical protein pb186bvf_004899 [Paramecium bursaria]
MFSMFQKKEQQPPQQVVQQQVPVQVPVQTQPQKSMFKGIKVKSQPAQEQQTPPKQNSEILQQESDAYKQQINSQLQETPTPVEPEIKLNVEEVQKKPRGFGFVNKKKPQEPQPDEQQQQDSNIIVNVDRDDKEPIQAQEIYDSGSYVESKIITIEPEVIPQQQIKQESPAKAGFLNKFGKKQKEEKVSQLDNSYQKLHQQIMDELNYFIQEANKNKSQIFLKQQQIEHRIQSLNQKSVDLENQATQLTAEQQICVEQEQFERAEEIEQTLKVIQEKLQSIEKTILQEEKIYQQLQEEKDNVRGEEYPFYQEIEQKLDEIERLQIKYTEEYKNEGSVQLKKLLQHIEEENERVKIQQIHTEINYKHLEDEENHIRQIMDNQSKQYRSEYEELFEQQKVLENEIEELKRILQQKQSELERVNEGIYEAQNQIRQVHQKFNQQLDKVQQKKNKLQDEISSLNSERSQIEILENDYERKTNDYQGKQEFLAQQLEDIRNKRQELTKKANYVPDLCNQEVEAIYKYNEAKAITDNNYKALKQIQKQIDELNYKRNLGQIQLNEILQKKSDLSIKLPKMLDEKTLLVQNKNFKGAQAVNEQIKDAQRQIQNYEEKITENQLQETSILKQIEQIDDELILRKSRYEESKQQSDINRYFVLELKLQEIHSLEEASLQVLVFEIQEEMNLLQRQHFKVLEEIKNKNQPPSEIIEPEIIQNGDIHEVQQEQQEIEQVPEPIQLTEEEKAELRVKLQLQMDELVPQIQLIDELIQECVNNEDYDKAEEYNIQQLEINKQMEGFKSQLLTLD